MAPAGRGLIAGYERLADLGELELELVRTGQYEALERLHEERCELTAALPPQAPAEACEPLLRAAALQAQTHGLLAGMVAISRQQLVRLGRGREAVGAYARHDARTPQLDSSA